MHFDFDNLEKPLFIQIAEQIKDGIIKGIYEEETQLPSSTEISITYRINPATVNKGVNLLVEAGIVNKRRGVGMFVSKGAVDMIVANRQEVFYENFIVPLINEAKMLEITKEDIINLINKENKEEGKWYH